MAGPVPVHPEARPTTAGSGQEASLDLDGLRRALEAVDPAAFLVEPRILRRVVRQDRDVGLFDWHGTHRHSYALPGPRAAAFLEREEVGLPPGRDWPPMLFLLAQPAAEEWDEQPPDQFLRRYWRLLFHARVVGAVLGLEAAGALTATDLRRRIDRIGQVPFDEIRMVLLQDHAIQDPENDVLAYAEFAGLYLELKHFAPHLREIYFPSLGDRETVEALLAADVDDAALVRTTRLPGAAEPGSGPPPSDDEWPDPGPDEDADLTSSGELRFGTHGRYIRLIEAATDASGRGNQVRAAMCRFRAADVGPEERSVANRLRACRELEVLGARLDAALGTAPRGAERWSRALTPLLVRASRGIWTVEARLLFDLQKAALDHEREVYELDPIGWLVSLGRRPWKRSLPLHQEVRVAGHLRSATRRLRRVRLQEHDREALTRALGEAVAAAESRLRERMRPRVDHVLDRCGWTPASVPEEVSREKMTEELLDAIVDRGFLALGDLRDAVSRNQLKLEDIADPREFLEGDRLLKTDRVMARKLRGVYRRGEFYLRGLQRLNSLAFGTRTGRILSLYGVLPFAGSFVLLKGLDHLIEFIPHLLGGKEVHLYSPASFLILGLFFLAVIASRRFRDTSWRTAREVGYLAAWPVRSFPAWLRSQAWYQVLIRSPIFAWTLRWIGKPLAFAFGTLLVLTPVRLARADAVLLAILAYVLAALLLNSRTGRDVEEILADRAVRFGSWLGRDFFPGLFRLVMDTFNRGLEMVERALYTIDEWFRFRSGQRRFGLAVRLVLGPFWRAITYVVRFAVNLVIEPQVNPIKHFPVVSVAHKLLLPYVLPIVEALKQQPLGLSNDAAWLAVGMLQLIVPGISGFLVWELKANWRLYRANRPAALQPVRVGSHGETLGRLLRPGFHSGTIPKLFARLRRAASRPVLEGAHRRSTARKYREKLHHVERDLARFSQREFVALLRHSRSLGTVPFGLERIALGLNRVGLTVARLDQTEGRLTIGFEEQSGWIVADLQDRGLLASLDREQRSALRDALGGLYKLAGVDLVREQIEPTLGPGPVAYDIAAEGLVTWSDAKDGTEIVHPLIKDRLWAEQWLGTGRSEDVRVALWLAPREPLAWDRWVEIWRRDRAGEGHAEEALPGVRILPDRDGAPDGLAVEPVRSGSLG